MTNIEPKEIKVLYIGNGIDEDYANSQSDILSGRSKKRKNINNSNDCNIMIKQVPLHTKNLDLEPYDVIISEEKLSSKLLGKVKGIKLIVSSPIPTLVNLSNENGFVLRRNFKYSYHLSIIFIDSDGTIERIPNHELEAVNNEGMNLIKPVIIGSISFYMQQMMLRYGRTIQNSSCKTFEHFCYEVKKQEKNIRENRPSLNDAIWKFDELLQNIEMLFEYNATGITLSGTDYDESLEIEQENPSSVTLKRISLKDDKTQTLILIKPKNIEQNTRNFALIPSDENDTGARIQQDVMRMYTIAEKIGNFAHKKYELSCLNLKTGKEETETIDFAMRTLKQFMQQISRIKSSVPKNAIPNDEQSQRSFTEQKFLKISGRGIRKNRNPTSKKI